ncbi:MAG: phosphoribosylformylglycinamidine synthase subunit PurL, partial [Actinomycetota bacterium]|nr:phosphoribosylformylglycinamidine synthase subunit PurL [Actinomycetota bacterium]
YYLRGTLSAADLHRLTTTLLHDRIVEVAHTFVLDADSSPNGERLTTVDVVLRPGVTDTPAESLLAGIFEIGMSGVDQAATGRRYALHGALSPDDAEHIAGTLLANDVIQTFYINEPAPPPFTSTDLSTGAAVAQVPLAGFDRQGLVELSKQRRLSLDGDEMEAIQEYFATRDRAPTDVELEMLAQTWSEHCVHKTFKALISYTGPPPGEIEPATTTIIDGILDAHIRAATETIDRPWVRSAFVDDAGIVALDETTDLAFKVETHNHPSALEPFGGANTGVGGVVRDVIGVSARPIANTNILCFGPEDTPEGTIPDGVLHPKRIADGVIAGIEDYGNKMGIPTVNGAVIYDPGYTANPLVFCGCLGVMPAGSHPTEPKTGDRVVVLGGRTGRDGLRGATFSSMESDHQTSEVSGNAVQIGHPIHEKQVLEAILIARDEGLYNAITDCGAGGLSSSVGEMAEELGAVVHLDRVPLKYPGLAPWEIWLSEAQERMVIAVPPANLARVAEISADLDVEMTVLGEFTGEGILRMLHDGDVVGEIGCDFLHNGIPRLQLTAVWEPPATVDTDLPWPDDPTATLLAVLGEPNTRSKEDIVRRYDHEVQGGTVVKPFVGINQIGPADAAVVVPLDTHREQGPTPGASLAVGINPAYGALDPYRMAWAAVDEAIRNVVAVGADPSRISILDNFSWGNPRLADRLGSLVRCTQGCYDAAVAYGTPFISGKDSLNNEYTGVDGRKHTIPGTLVISALGIVPDIANTVTSDLKASGNTLYVAGTTTEDLGGSAVAGLANYPGGSAPGPAIGAADGYQSLHAAITAELVVSCHDLSEGGLAAAAAEMAIGGDMGVEISLRELPRSADITDSRTAAFSESLGRFLVEVRPENEARFEAQLAGYPVGAVGQVRGDGTITITGLDDTPFIVTDVATVARAWRQHLEPGT